MPTFVVLCVRYIVRCLLLMIVYSYPLIISVAEKQKLVGGDVDFSLTVSVTSGWVTPVDPLTKSNIETFISSIFVAYGQQRLLCDGIPLRLILG